MESFRLPSKFGRCKWWNQVRYLAWELNSLTNIRIKVYMKIYYYRCNICLSVGAVKAVSSQKLKCSLCKEVMEEMGHVFDAKLVKEEERSVCDERCTRASGPSCDCKCNGKNHGTGLTTTVIIVQGDIPEINLNDGLALFRRNQYLKANEEAKRRLDDKVKSLNPNSDYYLIKQLKEKFIKALRII